MVDVIAPPYARITVAPAGAGIALTIAASRPAICTLSPAQARALARDLLAVAGASCDLVTIRPGPVLHVWRDGIEAGRLSLTESAALSLVADLVAAIRGAA